VKNKFFYFGNFEYNPIGQARVPGAPVEAPTSAGYAMLAQNTQVSATNLNVLKQYLGTAASLMRARSRWERLIFRSARFRFWVRITTTLTMRLSHWTLISATRIRSGTLDR